MMSALAQERTFSSFAIMVRFAGESGHNIGKADPTTTNMRPSDIIALDGANTAAKRTQ